MWMRSSVRFLSLASTLLSCVTSEVSCAVACCSRVWMGVFAQMALCAVEEFVEVVSERVQSRVVWELLVCSSESAGRA